MNKVDMVRFESMDGLQKLQFEYDLFRPLKPVWCVTLGCICFGANGQPQLYGDKKQPLGQFIESI